MFLSIFSQYISTSVNTLVTILLIFVEPPLFEYSILFHKVVFIFAPLLVMNPFISPENIDAQYVPAPFWALVGGTMMKSLHPLLKGSHTQSLIKSRQSYT